MKTMFLKKVTTLALVAVVAATFSPFGASAATAKYVSNQTILKEMVAKMSAVESMNFDGTFSIKPPAPTAVNSYEESPFEKLSIKFFGSQMEGVNGQEKSNVSLMFFDEKGTDLYPHVDTISDGESSYFKVSNLNWLADQMSSLGTKTPTSTNMQLSGLDKVDNLWIKITPDSIRNIFLSGVDASEENFGASSVEAILTKKTIEEREKALKQLGQIFQIAQKRNLFTISRLKDEVVGGENSYHLKLTLNKLRIKPFLLDAQKVMGGVQMTNKEINDAIKDFAKVQMSPIEIWVGKNDYLLRKISGTVKIKESDLKNAGSMELGFSMNFSSFNNATMIAIPSQYRSVEDVVKDFTKLLDERSSEIMVEPLTDFTPTMPEKFTPVPVTFNIPKTDKPKVELFLMSRDPFGNQQLAALLPVWELLKNQTDVQIKSVGYIMHGPTEKDDNTVEYCVQKEQSEKLVPFLKCFIDSAGDTKGCLNTVGVDQNKLNSCIAQTDQQYSITSEYNNRNHWLSGRFPLYNVHKDLNDKYNVLGSPTLVINGVQVSPDRTAEGTKQAVCAAFINPPLECQLLLGNETIPPTTLTSLPR